MLAPIKLHVDAKRYLCATRAGYYDALSVDSKRSLALQGGIFSPEEAAAFIAQPFAADAVAVRLWDDLAKVPGAATPPLAHFVAALEARSARSRAPDPRSPDVAPHAASAAVELTLGVTLAVLGAGLLHAGWNALLKSAGGGDPLLDTATIVAGSTVCSLLALPFVPLPDTARVAVHRGCRVSSTSATT